MPTIELNKRNIDSLKPEANRYTAWDSEISGFGLRITPNGRRVYILKYRVGGRQGWITIGRHGSPWTPKEARIEAQRLLGEIARGIDPAEKRRGDRKAMNFAELCDLYLAEGVSHKKPSTLRSDRGRVELHLKPLLGSKRVDAIGRADVERLQVEVRAGKTAAPTGSKRLAARAATGGQGVAAQCVALVSTILQFAVGRGLRPDNPARGVKKPPVRKMQRFLSSEELGRLGVALAQEPGSPYSVAAIKLLALTGCRLGEILNLHWSDVDLERGVLNLRDSKTREKIIYLSPPAAHILAELPRIVGNPFVIAGNRAGGALGGIDKIWSKIRRRAGLDEVRLHDLRHTYASTGAASGQAYLSLADCWAIRRQHNEPLCASCG
jgi:integrase